MTQLPLPWTPLPRLTLSLTLRTRNPENRRGDTGESQCETDRDVGSETPQTVGSGIGRDAVGSAVLIAG